MAWDDLGEIATRLDAALTNFDWEQAGTITAEVIARLRAESQPPPPKPAAKLLDLLRKKRRFGLMERLAEALLLADVRAPKVSRQYAQALIDQGVFAAAEFVLESLAQGEEAHEARGLLGRMYKQMYVNPGTAGPSGYAPFLKRAISEYMRGYEADRAGNYWHGINVVALLARARRDGVNLGAMQVREDSLAQRILSQMEVRLGAPNVEAYEIATAMEALAALGRWDRAFEVAQQYVDHKGADAFEIASTERQLTEVWQLSSDDPGPAKLMPLLRAELLEREGGRVALGSSDAKGDLDAARRLLADPNLEAVLGIERFKTLHWYKQGLQCCNSIARIETRSRQGFGTGWLIDGGEFTPKWKGQTVLITNKHVISPAVDGEPYRPTPTRRALLPEQARVHFQTKGETRLEVEEVLATSTDIKLDYTIVRVKKLPKKVEALETGTAPESLPHPPGRVYVIGHPAGRDLEFSLQDNEMLACNERLLHYRAPTEGGSSGSPVFESDDWRVIALHHAGGQNIPKLDASGDGYAANEGISLAAIGRDIRQRLE